MGHKATNNGTEIEQLPVNISVSIISQDLGQFVKAMRIIYEAILLCLLRALT